MEPKSQRRYDLDWLRVIAFSGVFFYHCARFFNSNDWHIKNATTSPVVDILTGLFDLWGMPLLFTIAGASIFYALRRGEEVRFVRERVLRLLVPWVVMGVLVLAPPQLYLEAVSKGELQGTFLQALPLYFPNNLAWSGVHLWFLRVLFVLTLALTPAFVWLKRPSGEVALARLSRFSVHRGAIFLWALPVMIVLILVDPYELLGPGLPELVLQCILYSAFVIYGYLIYADTGIQEAILRQRRAALILALALSPAIPVVATALESGVLVLTLPLFVLMMSTTALLTWSYLLAAIGYSMRYLRFNRTALGYASEAVLPIYILHQPVILLIGFFVIPLALPIAAKYAIITALALAITFGLYEYGVRRVNPVRFLFGLKSRRPDTRIVAASGPKPA
jgi:peptidoglycan/LPS O-acetylase OafA/YrhL